MDCENIFEQDLLRALLVGSLSDDIKTDVKQHVADCDACRSDLQLAATMMLQEPVEVQHDEVVIAEQKPSVWQQLRDWLFPEGMGWLQPAVAFAALAVVAVPVLTNIWGHTTPELSGDQMIQRSYQTCCLL